MLITSRANTQIKQIKRLLQRRQREETGLFFAEGFRVVMEAIRAGAEITTLVIAPDLLSEDQLQALEAHGEIPALRVTPAVFESISAQGDLGIAAAARQHWERVQDVSLTGDAVWVALNRIQHPGSLGTIIRVSDSVGGAGVILVGESTDPYDPIAVRASLGAVFSQRLARARIDEFAAWKREREPFVVGTSPAAATDYQNVSYRTPLVLYMGSERIGLSAEQQAICDVMVRIPMAGRVDSHHVAVAAALVLYESFNQRRARAGAAATPAATS